MKIKKLLFLLLVVVVAAVLGFALHRREAGRWTGGKENLAGRPLVPDLEVNRIAEIRIRDARDQLVVKRQDGAWGVADIDGYPVDFQRLRNLLLEIKDATFAQSVSGGESFHDRLNLLAPSGEMIASGVLLELLDEHGETLHSLIFGRNHYRGTNDALPLAGNWPQGRYVRVKQDGAVGLVANAFSAVTPERSRWLKRDFFRIGNIQSITMVDNGETTWEFSRAGESQPLTLAGEVPAGKKIDAEAVGALSNALGYASFADVAGRQVDDGQSGLDNPRICRMVDADGIQYTLHIGARRDNHIYLRVAVADVGPEQREAEAGESEEAAAEAEAAFADKLRERREKVAELGERLHGWTYLVNLHVLNEVNKTREDFFKDAPPPEAEENGEIDD